MMDLRMMSTPCRLVWNSCCGIHVAGSMPHATAYYLRSCIQPAEHGVGQRLACGRRMSPRVAGLAEPGGRVLQIEMGVAQILPAKLVPCERHRDRDTVAQARRVRCDRRRRLLVTLPVDIDLPPAVLRAAARSEPLGGRARKMARDRLRERRGASEVRQPAGQRHDDMQTSAARGLELTREPELGEEIAHGE